jgi:hypothetical protein
MEWISVEDRLPEPLVDVLAYCVQLEDAMNYKKDEKYCAIERFIDKWTDGHAASFRTDRFYAAKVTHWMPLPFLPKE